MFCLWVTGCPAVGSGWCPTGSCHITLATDVLTLAGLWRHWERPVATSLCNVLHNRWCQVPSRAWLLPLLTLGQFGERGIAVYTQHTLLFSLERRETEDPLLLLKCKAWSGSCGGDHSLSTKIQSPLIKCGQVQGHHLDQESAVWPTSQTLPPPIFEWPVS